jgi:hypothetical protein
VNCSSTVDKIVIFGGMIRAIGSTSTSAIGPGSGFGGVKSIVFGGNAQVLCETNMNGSGVNGTMIWIMSGSSTVFMIDQAPLFCVGPSNNGSFDLNIVYRKATMDHEENLTGLSGYFLHIGNSTMLFDSRFSTTKHDDCSRR